MGRRITQFRDTRHIDRLAVRIEDLQQRLTALRTKRLKLVDAMKKKKRRVEDAEYRERERARARRAMAAMRRRGDGFRGRRYDEVRR